MRLQPSHPPSFAPNAFQSEHLSRQPRADCAGTPGARHVPRGSAHVCRAAQRACAARAYAPRRRGQR
eukprot:302602-Chlamydomonas_euryale.AAC.1